MSLTPPNRLLALFILSLGLLASLSSGALAQAVDLANRPIAEIRVEGLRQVPQRLVMNQVRLSPGDPYNAETVEQDVVRITHLGRFASVRARVEPLADGTVLLTYVVQEQPLLSDVQVVGNRVVSDQELLALVLLRAGDPLDQFLVDRAIQEIRRRYESEGYFVTDVTIDQELLNEQAILIFQVREGPQVRIRQIEVEGNTIFSEGELRSQIRSRTHFPIFRRGELSRVQLEEDAARIRDYYRERGYLDAQVGRRIALSPDQRDAVVTFVVEEGRRYTVEQITVHGNEIFPDAQIIETLVLRSGDPFSQDRLRRSERAIIDMYGRLGFIDTTVQIDRLFHETQPLVDVRVTINEGVAYLVGNVSVVGNQTTKQKVIQRQVRGMEPGRPFDRSGIELTERRLRESALFHEANITLINPQGEDQVRDVLIEVKEANTGSVSFGAGVSSDAGVIGAIDLVQRNFDIADLPDSFGEFFTGRAFRGAGQYFSLALQPGNEYSRYAVTFREPYLLDSNIFLDTSVFYYNREREDWDEQRMGGNVALGRRFGDVWSARIIARGEEIELRDVAERAPLDVYDELGSHLLTSLGFSVTRSTVDSRLFPTQGNVLSASFSHAGALGGDYDFSRATASFNQYWTLDEDFLGRRSVLSLGVEAGYLFDDAPVFERFYAGGHRTLRGFAFRGAGPRGDYRRRTDPDVPVDPNDPSTYEIRTGDDPVGGDWLFLLSLEYNFPIYQDVVRMVVFTDTGTVQDDIGLDEYRVSIGTGIRLQLPFLGQAPFAFDIAYPLVKEDGDETRWFSFDIALPF